MTQQYQQRNINNPNGASTFTSSVGTPDVTISTDQSLIVIDSTAAASTATLPLASEVPGGQVTVVATAGTTNAVTVAAGGSDSISINAAAVNAVNPIVDDDAGIVFQSNGVDTWYAVGGTSY